MPDYQGRRCTQSTDVAFGSMEKARRDDLMRKESRTIYTRTKWSIISKGSSNDRDIV